MTENETIDSGHNHINSKIDGESITKAEFQPFGEEGERKSGGHGNIDLLLDVPLPVSVELGRATMTIRDILDLGAGSVVEVDRIAGEPVDILVNGKLVARGEVVVIDENFGVRILDIVSPEERLMDGN
ncbi:MAG: flagellar motor switch protein FliN [Firmicutes bacterium]|jgi:flagellar motor switch protein FliN/FliY|nr:flagellar motor switch protein FliN [Bacillota bacterium]